MKRMFIALPTVMLLFLTGGIPHAVAADQQVQLDSGDPVKAIKEIITTYLANITQGKAADNERLFLHTDVTVVGISRGEGVARIGQQKASEGIKYWQGVGPNKQTIDALEVDLLGDRLGVARLRCHNDAVNHWAVITLTRESGSWQIASYVFETFPLDRK